MATNGNFAYQEQYKGSADQYNAAPTAIDPTGDPGAGNDLSKVEVGWYFVEQYYTTLSKSPEKLHLFYGKRSQFVTGPETQVASVSVGRQAIQERIQELDFQDCKVRISNVDSQASFDGIVIQVIGAVSSKTGEPKKFVQTFVLAQQPSGYFVLNDILRYIEEEDVGDAHAAADPATEEPKAEEAAPAAPAEAEPVQATDAPEKDPAELDVTAADEKLEDAATSNGSEVAPAVETTKPATKTEAPVDADTAAQQVAEEDTKESEKPKEPSPTPAAKAEAAPAEPAAPPKPMTWASRAAAAAGPRPVVPLPKTATPPAQNQNKAPASAPAPAPAPAPAAAPAQASAPAPATEAAAKDTSGWQTAGADSKKQNRPQSISAAPAEKESTLGYVKYVTEKVQEADLRKALEAHGELAYFDINRQKNCAFVEYKTTEGYNAALNSNPHVVNGEQIVVEQRRPKSTAYGGSNYGSGRGGVQRGRGGFDGNRTGGQGNARGNFSGQNRGRGGARGRSGAQGANA